MYSFCSGDISPMNLMLSCALRDQSLQSAYPKRTAATAPAMMTTTVALYERDTILTGQTWMVSLKLKLDPREKYHGGIYA